MGALKALKRVLTKHGLLPKENVHYIEDDALMQVRTAARPGGVPSGMVVAQRSGPAQNLVGT